jgi:hypothetical protein
VLELRATPGNSGLRAAAGYYFFRSKRLAARGSIPGWRLDPSGWLLFFFPAAMLRLDARRNLCCFDIARLDTKRLDARWLLIIFFWLLRCSKRLDPAAWLLDPAANFAAASWRQAANRAAIIFFRAAAGCLTPSWNFPRATRKPPPKKGLTYLA